jgi:hypothetical protein
MNYYIKTGPVLHYFSKIIHFRPSPPPLSTPLHPSPPLSAPLPLRPLMTQTGRPTRFDYETNIVGYVYLLCVSVVF